MLANGRQTLCAQEKRVEMKEPCDNREGQSENQKKMLVFEDVLTLQLKTTLLRETSSVGLKVKHRQLPAVGDLRHRRHSPARVLVLCQIASRKVPSETTAK